MSTLNDYSSPNYTVDIGDLRVDFLGGSVLLSPRNSTESPLHLHTKLEFQYIASGTLDVLIDEETTLTIQQGSALLIPPNVLHRNANSEGQRLALTIAMQHFPNHSDPNFSEFHYYCEIFSKLRAPAIITNSTISYCVDQLLSLPHTPQNTHKIKNLFALLFIQLADCAKSFCQKDSQSSKLPQGDQHNHQYFLIEQYINTTYNQKTTVAKLAELLHISRRQADRIIMQIFGKTYAELVLEHRMSIAQTMVKKTDIPCAAIAEKVGYSSYTGFYIAFKKYFNMSPEEMRESANAQNTPQIDL